MTRTTRASLTTKAAILLAGLSLLVLVPAALAVGAETPTIKYTPESFATYQQQLAAGKIKAVTINKRVRSLRLTLTDGSYVLAKYKPHEGLRREWGSRKAGTPASSQLDDSSKICLLSQELNSY